MDNPSSNSRPHKRGDPINLDPISSKRSRDIFDTPETSTPPSKRARSSYNVGRASSSLAPTSSPFTLSGRSTPYTPYSFLRTPFSAPSDSPSNPFGIKRALVALTLPRAVGFAKHLALRFQLVFGDDADPDAPTETDSRRKRKGGERGKARQRESVYRIVQVPTNYTMRHLHKLILFLFASDVPLRALSRGISATAHRRSARVAEKRTANENRPQAKPTVDKGKAAVQAHADAPGGASARLPEDDVQIPDGWTHFFDVRTGISLYNSAYKPGVVKPGSGSTCARLSSVRERRLFPHLYDELNDTEGDVFDGPPGSSAPEDGEDADDEQGWMWEAEDDYTIRHAWPDGPELDRAIVYHHVPGVAVHITINTVRLPRRKGVGNKPYVFRARRTAHGAVRIAHLAAIARAALPATTRGAPASLPFDGDGEDPHAEWDEATHIRRWNSAHAFPRFLEREGAREGTLRRAASPASSLSPLLSPAGSPTRGAPLPASSPVRGGSPASSPTSLRELALSESPASDGYCTADAAYLSDPLADLPTTTPFPAHPAARRRVARVGRALERLTESGLRDMDDSDEDEEDELAGADELEDDDPPVEEVPPVEQEIDKSDWEQWEWDWDPFGEQEI